MAVHAHGKINTVTLQPHYKVKVFQMIFTTSQQYFCIVFWQQNTYLTYSIIHYLLLPHHLLSDHFHRLATLTSHITISPHHHYALPWHSSQPPPWPSWAHPLAQWSLVLASIWLCWGTWSPPEGSPADCGDRWERLKGRNKKWNDGRESKKEEYKINHLYHKTIK